jgi:NAD(P)-dependent dehydrogenase (short-subunit alcohol dehydrogenase family)
VSRLALVTGASSGIGEACAADLAERGYRVLAGVRREQDGERFRAVARVEPILLDVTDATAIAAAAQRVGDSLSALVNNAGIAVTGPVEVVPVTEWRRQIEVNFLGQVAVTQAMLPALLNARGRVVNVSSVGGRVVLPLFGPYSASKFALEAMTDALRREVESLGVRVVSVEPGAIATPIWDKGFETAEALAQGASPEAVARYAKLIDVVQREAQRMARLPPARVAEVIGEALVADRPRTRYVVGRQARARVALARLLPDRAFDRLLTRMLDR